MGETTSERLHVTVTGIEGPHGGVRIALFDSEATYLRQAHAAVVLDVAGPSVEWSIDVPPGEYALAVHHDENGNGRSDRGLFGLPAEPYGFSNDARRRFGPARWRDARFRVQGPTRTFVRVR